MTLGEMIRSRRMDLGLTQAALGKKLGWPDSRIGAYERDEIKPNMDSAAKLALALEIPVSALVNEPIDYANVWFAVVRWNVDDVIAAAAEHGITLSREQAAAWWKQNETSFSDRLVEYGNEILANVNFVDGCTEELAP